MPKQTLAHEYLEWTKQKFDETDATLATLDDLVGTLKNDARTKPDRAVAQIRTTRDAFKAKVDAIRSGAAITTKVIANDVGAHATIEWAKARLSEIDASIKILAEDASKLDNEARKRADATLQKLRATAGNRRAEDLSDKRRYGTTRCDRSQDR